VREALAQGGPGQGAGEEADGFELGLEVPCAQQLGGGVRHAAIMPCGPG